MTGLQLKLMMNVFKRRIAGGESSGDIAKDYPKLTEKDLKQIIEALEDVPERWRAGIEEILNEDVEDKQHIKYI